MLPNTTEEWIGSGIVTLAVAVISLLWKIKHERQQAVEQAKKAAVDASASALGIVQAAMVTQGEQVTQLNNRVNDLNIRVTALDQTKRIAIQHIADREAFAIKEWSDRPPGLPPIPTSIIKEVIEHQPSISLHYQADIIEEEVIYSEEDDEEDDADPKEGYSGYG